MQREYLNFRYELINYPVRMGLNLDVSYWVSFIQPGSELYESIPGLALGVVTFLCMVFKKAFSIHLKILLSKIELLFP